MKKLIPTILIVTMMVAVLPITASAAAIAKYTTKTVDLKEKPDAKSTTIAQVQQNQKLNVKAQNKTWATVLHNDQTVYVKTAELHKTKAVNKWKGKSFKRRGRGKWNKCSWTWYSSRQLSGKGLKIPGRHIDKKRGFILDKDGYICLASGRKNKKKKAIVPTPFGRYGKVYDTNGRNNNKWFDVYVNW